MVKYRLSWLEEHRESMQEIEFSSVEVAFGAFEDLMCDPSVLALTLVGVKA